ncbi:MAG: hypothetical protein Q8S22_06145 [Eubacteriales bacterium]|jgi:hypothetical protein|nr:hypothetical protein [Eubacteriales bacterium]
MERKPLRVAIALSLALALALICACAPRFVGEERAKSAGLALLRQAFGVKAEDAHVEYFERAGSSVVDNTEVQPGAKPADQIYIVTISDQTLGADLYYAEVDAKSGVAYYATKNEWLLAPLSEDQQQQTTEINNLTDGADADAAVQNDYTEHTARNAAMRCFQKEVALISAKGCCRRDNVLSPRVSIGYFVTFADGALYRVAFSWPAMDLNEVQVLGTEAKGERP